MALMSIRCNYWSMVSRSSAHFYACVSQQNYF